MQAPVAIRLNDGSTGTLRVEAKPCEEDECQPATHDCGCFAPDSYWIVVTRADGQAVARMPLWAAYGMFDIVPVDLVDGPGDELVIARIGHRGSPPFPPDFWVWKIGGSKPLDLFAPRSFEEWLRSYLGSSVGPHDAVACAELLRRLSIDPTAPKPRRIAVTTSTSMLHPGCHLTREGRQEVATERRPQAFVLKAGVYRRRFLAR
jgi:hypothetical protein